jgi:hypothetical protein
MSAPSGSGNHALQDYQMQLMLLEVQNKKRLLMARQELDTHITQALDDKYLVGLRDPLQQGSHYNESSRRYPVPQSRVNHGLPTPNTTPQPSPSNQASIGNSPAYTPHVYNAPGNAPSTEINCLSSSLSSQDPRYPTYTYHPQLHNSFGYQKYHYPHTTPDPAYNTPDNCAFMPTNFIPGVSSILEQHHFPSWEPLFSTDPSSKELVAAPMATQIPHLSEESTNSEQSALSDKSMGSCVSMDSRWTYDSGYYESSSPPPNSQRVNLSDFSGLGSDFAVSINQDFLSDPDSDRQPWNSCNKATTPPSSIANSFWGKLACPISKQILSVSANKFLECPTSASNQLCTNSPPCKTSDDGLSLFLSTLPTDKSLDMDFDLSPTGLAQNLHKKVSRPSGLFDFLQEREQGHQSELNTTSRGHQDHQVSLSQDSSLISGHGCKDNVLNSIEASPLPYDTKQVINTTPEPNLVDTQPQSSCVSSFSRSGSETCSWVSSDETDWGDDEIDDFHVLKRNGISGEEDLSNHVTGPVLSKVKQELVDRLMVEFWQIFNQEDKFKVYVWHDH